MKPHGWIYVATMSNAPGLVKIGYTDRDPQVRVAEWGRDTGAPGKAILEFQAWVQEPVAVERAIHQHLNDVHERSEWFRYDVLLAVKVVRELSTVLFEQAFGNTQVMLNQHSAAAQEIEKYQAEIREIFKSIRNSNKINKTKMEKEDYESTPTLRAMAERYINGDNVKKDANHGIWYYKKAADNGDVTSQIILGHVYMGSVVAPKDYIKAYMWFSVAAETGSSDTHSYRDKVAKQMKPSEVEEAQHQTREWFKHHPLLATPADISRAQRLAGEWLEKHGE